MTRALVIIVLASAAFMLVHWSPLIEFSTQPSNEVSVDQTRRLRIPVVHPAIPPRQLMTKKNAPAEENNEVVPKSITTEKRKPASTWKVPERNVFVDQSPAQMSALRFLTDLSASLIEPSTADMTDDGINDQGLHQYSALDDRGNLLTSWKSPEGETLVLELARPDGSSFVRREPNRTDLTPELSYYGADGTQINSYYDDKGLLQELILRDSKSEKAYRYEANGRILEYRK